MGLVTVFCPLMTTGAGELVVQTGAIMMVLWGQTSAVKSLQRICRLCIGKDRGTQRVGYGPQLAPGGQVWAAENGVDRWRTAEHKAKAPRRRSLW